MEIKEYAKLAIRTESGDAKIYDRCKHYGPEVMDRILAGITQGDRADKLKRRIFYGTDQVIAQSSAKLTEDAYARTENVTRLIHAFLGLQSELGEFAEILFKYINDEESIDYVNLAEEMGDKCWYINLVFDWLGKEWGDSLKANIDKLAARYPKGFTDYHAQNRDLEKERKILENG